MLTNKQYELLIFINDSLIKSGVCPSFDEMKEALDLKSKSGIHRLITGLVERRFIRRLPHRARALEVLKLPENSKYAETPSSAPNVIKGNFSSVVENFTADKGSVELPFLGKIAAGTPIEAINNSTIFVDIPSSMAGRGERYALEVEGDSMIEAGIHNGDTVVIEKCDTAENGTIVVALVDDRETTLKRIQRKGLKIALEPANKSYKTQMFSPDRIQIQGKLVGLIRTYH